MILYRSVGLQELALIYDSGMKAFPAGLPQQPIYYLVLQLDYARQTAREWNANRGALAGYVTQVKVEDEYIDQFEEHAVGESQYRELWIPAEEMAEFNKHVVGHIKVVEAHFGDLFQGFVPDKFGLQGKNAAEQFTVLANSFLYKRMDFYLELKRNHKAVFLNYPFWHRQAFKNPGLKEKVLKAIQEAWLTSFPQIPLAVPPPDPDEDTPIAQTDRTSLFDPEDEEFAPSEQEDSEAWEDHVDARETPVEQTNAPVWVRPAPHDVAPVEQTRSPLPANPIEEEATLPEETDSHFAQGVALGLGGNYQEAVAALFKAVQEDPDHVVAHTSLGVAFHRLGEDGRALSCYETALKVDPIYAEAHYFRANLLYRHGSVREAIAGYTVAIGLQPELIEAHEKPNREDRLTDFTDSPAEIYRIAKPARRILELNELLASDPGQASLFKERAAEYYRLRNYAQAIADYTSALAIQPDDASALHSRGAAYDQLGQSNRAREDYQQAIALDAHRSNEYINRGIAFAQAGNYRQALSSLTEGIRLAPRNPDGYFNRGMAYFLHNNFEGAIEDFSEVIRLAPQDEDTYYWRGISNHEVGRQDEAIADYRQFLAISKNPQLRKEIEHRLNQLNADKNPGTGRLSSSAEESPVAPQTPLEKTGQQPDLHALIVSLGRRALDSIWFGNDVECYGEKAEELNALTRQNTPIEGRDFLSITSSIRQTVRGDFYALDPDADAHWLWIRAWDGSGFYVETDDPKIRERLQSRFHSLEDVEGASPPYVGFFIHI